MNIHRFIALLTLGSGNDWKAILSIYKHNVRYKIGHMDAEFFFVLLFGLLSLVRTFVDFTTTFFRALIFIHLCSVDLFLHPLILCACILKVSNFIHISFLMINIYPSFLFLFRNWLFPILFLNLRIRHCFKSKPICIDQIIQLWWKRHTHNGRKENERKRVENM